MDCLPDVWRKVEKIAEALEEIHTRDFTHQDLTQIRDDLNECAETVQVIRDQINFE